MMGSARRGLGGKAGKAWLYGKLLVALLVEKPTRHTVAVSL